MSAKLTPFERLCALIALPGQYRLVSKDRVIPEGYKLCPPDYKLCPPGSKVVKIASGFKHKEKELVKVEIIREDRP